MNTVTYTFNDNTTKTVELSLLANSVMDFFAQVKEIGLQLDIECIGTGRKIKSFDCHFEFNRRQLKVGG